MRSTTFFIILFRFSFNFTQQCTKATKPMSLLLVKQQPTDTNNDSAPTCTRLLLK